MTIEDKVFKRMKFDPERMEAYGFRKDGASYALRKELLDGDFTAVLCVGPDGSVQGRVIDELSGEDFDQLRNVNYNGSFVNTVRDAYEKLLLGIARECCREMAFAADQSNRIAAWICSEYGVIPDFPWDDRNADGYGVFRHHGSRRWFGLIMNIRRGQVDKSKSGEAVDVINLKIEEKDVASYRAADGIYPGWHMNHRTWISVILDDSLADERVEALIRNSFRLTESKPAVMDEKLVREVLGTALSIPFGRVASYGQIARLVGREKNARMVGKIMSMADRYGDYPCHRVVNSAGRTVPGWPEQRELLEAEGIRFKSNGCVDMKEFQWNR